MSKVEDAAVAFWKSDSDDTHPTIAENVYEFYFKAGAKWLLEHVRQASVDGRSLRYIESLFEEDQHNE